MQIGQDLGSDLFLAFNIMLSYSIIYFCDDSACFNMTRVKY